MKTPYSRPDQFDLNSPIDYWAESNARKQLAQTGRNPGRLISLLPLELESAAMARRIIADREAAEAKMRAEVAAAEEARLLEEAKDQAFIHKILNSLKAHLPFQTPKVRKKKEPDPFAFRTHLKQVLELVMPVIRSSKDPWGNCWSKVTPYFKAPDLIKALHHLGWLDDGDIDVSNSEQMESRGKTLKDVLQGMGYQFTNGKPAGSKADREEVITHLAKVIDTALPQHQIKRLARLA